MKRPRRGSKPDDSSAGTRHCKRQRQESSRVEPEPLLPHHEPQQELLQPSGNASHLAASRHAHQTPLPPAPEPQPAPHHHLQAQSPSQQLPPPSRATHQRVEDQSHHGPQQDDASQQAAVQTSTRAFEHEQEPLPPMQIHIKWASATGKTKVTELPLKLVASTNELTGVHKRLTNRVFAERDLPDFLVSDNYLKFSTCEECLNMPLDVLSTNFKLAAFKDGWQYVVHDSRVSAPETRDNQPKLHVTIIEFDSIAHIVGHLGIRMSMVAYPLITIHKEFLLSTLYELRTDPNFRGIFD